MANLMKDGAEDRFGPVYDCAHCGTPVDYSSHSTCSDCGYWVCQGGCGTCPKA